MSDNVPAQAEKAKTSIFGFFKNGVEYKWIALSNVIIATMMGTVNGSIILISLPAIFNGISINPLTSFQYLLWLLMGYGIVTATLLLTFGRLSDMYGRARIFKLGFLIFTIGSVLLYLTPGTGDEGAIELIVFRLLQAVGGAMFMANSAAILTDAFPPSERGKALGLNMVAVLSGQFIGLILGGVLAVYDWRLVFLVSVPFAVVGTIWSYLKLREVSFRAPKAKVDILGNITFVAGLVLLLIGVTYGLMPYENDPMGWSSPWVIASLAIGFLLLIMFPVIESRVESPMFRLELFKIRAFSYANIANLVSAIARGGVMFMLILLLQGIWLPLHGYSYESTPLWAGIYMLPLTVGFIVAAPVSGMLSDRYGPRWIATGGMLIVTLSFLLLAWMPYDFEYWQFALALFIMGAGNGMFGSPNSASIMSSVPPEERGVASGMMSTLMNTANTASMAIFFTIVIVGITSSFPSAMTSSLASLGAAELAPILSSIPPTGALFAAFLGYNPVSSILAGLPPSIVSAIPASTISALESSTWFPSTLAEAFMPSLRLSFYIGAILCAIAAILSAMRGERYIHEAHAKSREASP
ncbi:MFS transporter [Methanocella conradii]|uniref:MFS transporter n=1 Tax=Methanocella conradii TaxID=1175444 RepID=UPI0024B3ADF5|nr:MFS transporter [Methanocella conradii]MDI6897509.1 MFS transporter [Methanocella conradii]